jgi:hypothetical protein
MSETLKLYAVVDPQNKILVCSEYTDTLLADFYHECVDDFEEFKQPFEHFEALGFRLVTFTELSK